MTTKQKQLEAVQMALLAHEVVNPVEAMRRGAGACAWLRLCIVCGGHGWPVLTERDLKHGLARYRLPDGWTPPTPSPETKKPR